MTNVLFDTTVFIDYPRGRKGAAALFDDVFGRRLLGSLLKVATEVPFGLGHAQQVGMWLRGYSRSQCLGLAADAMIAATAASLSATILTRDPRDFMRFYTDVQPY